MQELLYFAYGSNLYFPRMQARVASSRIRCIASLAGHEVRFHKRGIDGSGKCNLVESPVPEAQVHGVVYVLSTAEVGALDAVEVPDYRRRPLWVVGPDREAIETFTYQAPANLADERLRPFAWYRDLVLVGAREQGLPEWYIQRLAQVQAVEDPDEARDARNRYGTLARFAGCE